MADNIYSKLLAVQTELKAPKQQYNSFGKYKYRSTEDILEAVKPILKKHGLTLTITDTIEDYAGRVYVCAVATITDGEKAEQCTAYAREPEMKKGMDDSQITGAASSYARKYALSGLFLLDDTKDADHDKTHHSGADDITQQVKDLRTEVFVCNSIKELEAHYKANESFVKEHNLIDYYAKKRQQLS